MERNQIDAAFAILVEEIEHQINGLKEEIAQAAECDKFDTAKALSEQARSMKDFLQKVKLLQKEWNRLVSKRPQRQRITGRGKLSRGLRTPEEAYRRPILEALVELGGRARIGDVLKRVEEKMRGTLNKLDYDSLRSSPDTPRWRNTAQWCRNSLVNEKLMKNDSPRGIWEVSDAGRKWLEEQN